MYQSLKEYIKLKTGLKQSRQEAKDLELRLTSKIDFLASFMNLTWPERLELDPHVLMDALGRFRNAFNDQRFETAIHKNDLMFAFHLNRFLQDPAEALLSYYRVGYSTAKNLQSISTSHNLKTNKILDFGSGYGRVSRFLPNHFQHSVVVVSEVKGVAMDFQEQEFGFRTITHSQDVSSFPDESFDLIFALSVFTHLPQNAFEAWLQKLLQSLSSHGGLIISFLDQQRPESKKVLGNFTNSPKAFQYITRSEDSYFSFVSDSIKDDQDYGSSFITRDYLKELGLRLGAEISFLNYQLVPSQDAALVKLK